MTHPTMLTIGAVARRAGLRPSALRYYEAAGLLPVPLRVNGWRRYDETIFGHVAALRLAQEAGFSLAEIRTLLHGFARGTTPSARFAAFAERKLAEADALVARGKRMRRIVREGLACGCRHLEDCASVRRRLARPNPSMRNPR